MTEKGKVHVGEVLGPLKGLPSALDGFNALNQLVNAARECITVHAVENSKQARIAAYETTEVTRIKAAESILRNYFGQVFAERRTNFDGLFTRLDQALEQGNAEVAGAVLKSIVDVARTSPLGDLNDLSQIRAALDDPDQVWDL
ncbi:hypothetical protein [Tomitella biformata]|uniref:hypothetical protein n=1 Tax=Tomitella biformata TaxID=630403 RepID=UPI00046716DE|nr:hypothetical protein [Tomitella biformata]